MPIRPVDETRSFSITVVCLSGNDLPIHAVVGLRTGHPDHFARHIRPPCSLRELRKDPQEVHLRMAALTAHLPGHTPSKVLAAIEEA